MQPLCPAIRRRQSSLVRSSRRAAVDHRHVEAEPLVDEPGRVPELTVERGHARTLDRRRGLGVELGDGREQRLGDLTHRRTQIGRHGSERYPWLRETAVGLYDSGGYVHSACGQHREPGRQPARRAPAHHDCERPVGGLQRSARTRPPPGTARALARRPGVGQPRDARAVRGRAQGRAALAPLGHALHRHRRRVPSRRRTAPLQEG